MSFALPEKRLFPISSLDEARSSWKMVSRTKNITNSERVKARRRILSALRSQGGDVVDYQMSITAEGERISLLRLPVLRKGLLYQEGRPDPLPITDDTFDQIMHNHENHTVGFTPYLHEGHFRDGRAAVDKSTGKVDDKESRGNVILFERGTGTQEFEDNDPDTLYAYVEPNKSDIVQKVNDKEFTKCSIEFFRNFLDRRDGRRKGTVVQAIGLTNAPQFPDLGDVHVVQLSSTSGALGDNEVSTELIVAYNSLDGKSDAVDKETSVGDTVVTQEAATLPQDASTVEAPAAAPAETAAPAPEATASETAPATEAAPEAAPAEAAPAEQPAEAPAEAAPAEAAPAEAPVATEATPEQNATTEEPAASQESAGTEEIVLLDGGEVKPEPFSLGGFGGGMLTPPDQAAAEAAQALAAMPTAPASMAAMPTVQGEASPATQIAAPTAPVEVPAGDDILQQMQKQMQEMASRLASTEKQLAASQKELVMLSSSVGNDPLTTLRSQYVTVKGIPPAFVDAVIDLARGQRQDDGLMQLSSSAEPVSVVDAIRHVLETYPGETVALNSQEGVSAVEQLSIGADGSPRRAVGYQPFQEIYSDINAALAARNKKQ